jgi:predicted enzyme related to lactoylglutathione lyase/RNAse (barnase) inhibitor barstar
MIEKMLLVNELGELQVKWEKPIIQGVACIFIHVKDVAKSKKWYMDHLGINVDQESPNCGKINLGLWPHPDPVPSTQPLFVLETPNLAEAHRIMKENGVKVDEAINWNCWYFNFFDPDGNIITMWQQDEEAIMDFREVKTTEGLHRLIKSKLYLRNSYRYNWESFSEILLTCTNIKQRKIVLKGWDTLQERLPNDAKMMIDLVVKHNSRYPSHTWTLEVRDE